MTTPAAQPEAPTENATPEQPPVEAEAPLAPAEPVEVAPAEPAPAEGEEAPPEADPKPESHKRAGGWQRKIDRLERERQVLLEQLARTGQAPQPVTPPKAKTPNEEVIEYVDALVQKQLADAEAKRQQQAAQAAFQARAAEFRTKHPDFDEVVESVGHIPVPPYLNEAILTSEQNAGIIYALASNPAELARISALPPLVAIREVGRLEAKLASGTATPAKPNPAPAPRKPAAPAPITPVTSRGPTTVKAPDQMSYEEFCDWRDSQRTKR